MRMESVMSGECKMVSVRGREGKERTRVKRKGKRCLRVSEEELVLSPVTGSSFPYETV